MRPPDPSTSPNLLSNRSRTASGVQTQGLGMSGVTLDLVCVEVRGPGVKGGRLFLTSKSHTPPAHPRKSRPSCLHDPRQKGLGENPTWISKGPPGSSPRTPTGSDDRQTGRVSGVDLRGTWRDRGSDVLSKRLVESRWKGGRDEENPKGPIDMVWWSWSSPVPERGSRGLLGSSPQVPVLESRDTGTSGSRGG